MKITDRCPCPYCRTADKLRLTDEELVWLCTKSRDFLAKLEGPDGRTLLAAYRARKGS